MGCCKSRENTKDTEDTKDTLLTNDQRSHNAEERSNGSRGVSLQQNFSPFVGFLNNFTSTNMDSDDENEGGAGPGYEPPIIVEKLKLFEGKSIMKPPHLDQLKRMAWIDKRGHLVRDFLSRLV